MLEKFYKTNITSYNLAAQSLQMAMQFDKYVRSAYYRLKSRNTALPCIFNFLLPNQTATKISRKTNFPYPIYLYYTATLLRGSMIIQHLHNSQTFTSYSEFFDIHLFHPEPTEQTGNNAGDPKSFLLRLILLWGLFHLVFGFALKGWQMSCKF